MNNLEETWRALWRRNAPSDPDAQYAALFDAYTPPYRAYHNLNHVQDCLQQLENCALLPQDPDAVQLALWFHDVIYEIGAPDNEEQSAQWAAIALSYDNVSPDFITTDTISPQQTKFVQNQSKRIEKVSDLILATKHPSTPISADAKLVVDIDLSILGRAPAEFMQYEKRIRIEYQQVPEERYRSGRAKILRGILERPSIYLTEPFRDKYEVQARKNLADSITALDAG